MKQETLKDKKFQQKLVDKLNNGELSYQNAPIYTILLDLVQGNSVDEVYRVFCEVIKEQNNNKYSEEDMIAFYNFIENHQLRKFGDVWKRITNNPNDKPLNFESVDDNYIIEWFEQFKKK